MSTGAAASATAPVVAGCCLIRLASWRRILSRVKSSASASLTLVAFGKHFLISATVASGASSAASSNAMFCTVVMKHAIALSASSGAPLCTTSRSGSRRALTVRAVAVYDQPYWQSSGGSRVTGGPSGESIFPRLCCPAEARRVGAGQPRGNNGPLDPKCPRDDVRDHAARTPYPSR